MSEQDDQRVEVRLSLTGKLVTATPERIEELNRLRDEREKLSRPQPTRSFGDVMKSEQKEAAGPEASTRPAVLPRGQKPVHKGPPPKAPPRAGASGKKIIRG